MDFDGTRKTLQTHRLNRVKLVVVCGATATGKTDLTFELAKRLNTEIISFDSVQVYKHMDIGTAKPPREMLKEIRHHFIDHAEPDEIFTAGDFKKQAEQVLAELSQTKSHAVAVGGTGFYLQALIKGMYEVPEISPRMKSQLAAESASRGMAALYAELQERDPRYAAHIHSADSYRILRALEILRSGPKTVTEIREEFSRRVFPYEVVTVGLRRLKPKLLESVRLRTAKMLDEGLIEETRGLLEKYPSVPRPLESVGYKETREFLAGTLNRDELFEKIVGSTMALAKRQATWFKRDATIKWYDPDENSDISEAILAFGS